VACKKSRAVGILTVGKTGKAKGVMLSLSNLVNMVCYGLQIADVYERCLSVLPYHHTYESVVGILVAIHKRATICINDSLKNVLKNLNTFKPDYIYVVPAFTEKFYKSIWSNAEKSGKDKLLKIMIPVSNGLRKIGIDLRGVLFKSVHEAFGGNLREIVCGGAPIRPEIGKFFNDIGMMLLNGYGISECSPLVSVNREQLNDPSTVGVILPCCEVKIENPNEDGDGEIWVKGDIVMMGYYKEPEKTAKVLKDGWFNTEDYGRINKKGQLVINGRKKNVIVLNNGKNIYPEEIENYVMRVPYVQEAIVKAVKNDQGQEISLCAEVFLNQEKVKELGIENIEETLKKDISKVTKELPVWKRVTKTEIRETEFNKTTTNKIKR
jgi:long-chain acyl-CoA synthetase